MDDLQSRLLQETNEFNRFLEDSFASPEIMESRLSEIQARVAILTKGWYGSTEKDTAREEFNWIMLRFEAITFFIRQLKSAMKAKVATKEHMELILKAISDKKLEKQIKGIQGKLPAAEFDALASESWQAIVLNLGVRLRRAIYTGIENRLRKEVEAQAKAEELRAQNTGFLLGEALKSLGGFDGYPK